ncbi:MAG: diadenylate cyclase CdaA [Dehalococcoidia bacterium]
MPDFVRSFIDAVRYVDARSAVDIFLIAAIIYAVLTLLRGTTAMSLLRGAAIIAAAAWALAYALDLTVLKWLLGNMVTGLFIAVPVIFQPEIRRTLERVGRTRVTTRRSRPTTEALITAVVAACGEMSRQRCGALMVIERETGLQDYIATGRRQDAAPTEDLLATIFFRNSPLHDGALIIRGDRIVAAGCTLPLTDAPMQGHVGTRHRAGIGVTERTDAVAVIVSEETGDVSVATNGRMVSKLDGVELRGLLTALLGQDDGGAGGRGRRRLPSLRRLLRAVGGSSVDAAGQEPVR